MMQRIAVPVLAIALLVGVAVVILLVGNDDDGEPTLVVVPSTTVAVLPTSTAPAPIFPATPTPENLPTLPPTEGTLVYLLDNDLWVAPLDQSAPPRQIIGGNVHVGYAGYVKHGEENTELYFVDQVSEDEFRNGRTEAEFVLYRVELPGGEPQELHRYTSRPGEANASVSPDGQYVLLSDSNGLLLLDFSTGETQLLLAHSGPCQGPKNCFGYRQPSWSPNGDLAQIAKGYWEGSRTVLIDPLSLPVVELEIDYSGSASWSPDSTQLCMRRELYVQAGPIVVYDLENGKASDTSLSLDVPVTDGGSTAWDALGCAWASGGMLAISYAGDLRGRGEYWVVLLDKNLSVVHQTEPIEARMSLVDWLANSSGVVVNLSGRQGDSLGVSVVLEDGSVAGFPFGIDRALAVIP